MEATGLESVARELRVKFPSVFNNFSNGKWVGKNTFWDLIVWKEVEELAKLLNVDFNYLIRSLLETYEKTPITDWMVEVSIEIKGELLNKINALAVDYTTKIREMEEEEGVKIYNTSNGKCEPPFLHTACFKVIKRK